jgi:tetratricopeptide (TPR) repeat protein
MIFTYRPEFVHTWGGKSYHSQVTLNRLSNRESLAMAINLLGTKNIDRNLEDLILEKTEGIPFFIEELIKSLKTLNIIERQNNTYRLAKDIQAVTIPSTIQDVIMARVDSLPEGAKEVIQIGSVIEREFGYETIKKVSGLEEKKLFSYLSALKDSELLYERGIYPDTTYIFKHALTREVVYDSILTKRKKKLHVKIGNAIEDTFGENIVEHYEVLAEHYIAGEDYEKGAQFSRMAGKKAEKTASFVDALDYGQKGIACLEKLPLTAGVQKKIIDARTTLGLYFSQLGHLAEAQKAVDPIINVALQSAGQKRCSQIHTIIGLYNTFVKEDLSKALHHLEEALRIAKEINHKMSLFFSSYWLSLTLWHNCEFEKAINQIKKALDINVAANSLWGVVAMKCQLSLFFNYQGRDDIGYHTSQEALRIAEESGDIYSKSWGNAFHGMSCYYKGFTEEARDCLLKGVDFSERLDFWENNLLAQTYLGHTYSEIGDNQNSKHHFAKALSIGQKAEKAPSEINFFKTAVSRANALDKDNKIDPERLYSYVADNKSKHYEGWMQRNIAEIHLQLDNQNLYEAQQWIEKAIEADKKNGMRWHLAMDYVSYAEVFKRQGDQSKARDNLSTAIEIFKKCGADGWVDKYEKEAALISGGE